MTCVFVSRPHGFSRKQKKLRRGKKKCAANFTLNFTAQCVILRLKGVDIMPNIKPISDLRNYNEVLRDVEGVAICKLTKEDVVRHVMVQRIIEAYAKFEEKKK